MKIRMLILIILVLLVMLVIAGSCVRRLALGVPVDSWTPASVAVAPITPTERVAILSTRTPAPGQAPGLGRTPTVLANPPAAPTLLPTVTVQAPDPTPDPKRVVITEADVVRAVASGAAAQNGLSLEGLSVRFADERLRLAADRLRYGSIDVQNLIVVGRLVAVNGKLQLEAESITPRGLVTALIPTFANQALAQYTAQWYIEEVRTVDSRLELKIR